jgi:hypothetical protein
VRTMIAAHVNAVVDGDGAILLDLAKGKYFSLNGLGAEIWQRLELGESVADIEAHIRRTRAVSTEAVGEDVTRFIEGLANAGLLRIG